MTLRVVCLPRAATKNKNAEVAMACHVIDRCLWRLDDTHDINTPIHNQLPCCLAGLGIWAMKREWFGHGIFRRAATDRFEFGVNLDEAPEPTRFMGAVCPHPLL